MRVSLERTGGFAGMKFQTEIDVTTLPPAQERRLRKLVTLARFFELPETLRSRAPGVDRFQYRLTVDSGEQAHTVEMDESAVPPAVRTLLDFLAGLRPTV